MAHPFSRKELYRTHLEEYSEKWKEYFHFKRSDGILEVRMHSDGGPCRWDIEIHRALIPAFADIHFDPENECVILTGTGDNFLAEFDDESWGRLGYRDKFTFGHSYDHFYFDQTKEPFALLNLEIPVIAAIISAVAIQIATNLANDSADGLRGADDAERLALVRDDLIDAGVPPSKAAAMLEDSRAQIRRRFDWLRKYEAETADTLERRIDEINAAFNPYWGSVFTARHDTSQFGAQVELYACLYTSRVTNFRYVSPVKYFHSPANWLPHWKRVAES